MSDLIDRQLEKTHEEHTETHACDCVSRQAAIDEIKAVYEWHDVVTQDRLIEHLKEMPSVQPQRQTGRWVGYNTDKEDWKRTDGSPVFMSCSECYGTVLNNGSAHWNYCPNCGAKMEVEHDCRRDYIRRDSYCRGDSVEYANI